MPGRAPLGLVAGRVPYSPGSVSVTLTRPGEVALPNETGMGRVYDLPEWYTSPYQVEDRIPYTVAPFERWRATTEGPWTPRDEEAYQAVIGWMRQYPLPSKPEGPWEMFGPTGIVLLGTAAGYLVQLATGAPTGELARQASEEAAAELQDYLDAEAAAEAAAVLKGLGDPELTRYRLDWYLYTASMGYRYDPVSGEYRPIGYGELGVYRPSRLRPADYGQASTSTSPPPRAPRTLEGLRPAPRGVPAPGASALPSRWTLAALAALTAAALLAF
jgi:hypothetical protein